MNITGFKNIRKIPINHENKHYEFDFSILTDDKHYKPMLLPTADMGVYVGERIETEKVFSVSYKTYNKFIKRLFITNEVWHILLFIDSDAGAIEPLVVKKISNYFNTLYYETITTGRRNKHFMELYQILQNIFNKTAESDGWIVYQ